MPVAKAKIAVETGEPALRPAPATCGVRARVDRPGRRPRAALVRAASLLVRASGLVHG